MRVHSGLPRWTLPARARVIPGLPCSRCVQRPSGVAGRDHLRVLRYAQSLWLYPKAATPLSFRAVRDLDDLTGKALQSAKQELR